MTAPGFVSVACRVNTDVACDQVALVMCTVSAGKIVTAALPADVPAGAKPPAYDAVTDAVAALAMPLAWAVKLTRLAPAGTVPVAGNCSALGLIDVSVTT